MGLLSLSNNVDVALEGVHVEAKILDMVAEVNMLQFYFNDSPTEIQAKYVFPLDSNSAVCDFQAEVNGNIVQGKVKEKQEARREYNAAVQRGDRAYLLEKNLPDVFQVLVGNIPAYTRCTIKLTYIVELSNAGGEGGDEAKSVQFLLPTAVAPRYSPYHDRYPYSRPWYNSFSNSFSWSRYIISNETPTWYQSNSIVLRNRPYALSLYIEAEMPSSIVKIGSTTHNIQHNFNDDEKKKSTIMFVRDAEAMDKDVVINILTSEPNQPRVLYEEGASATDQGAFMMTLVPQFKLDDISDCEFIFLVDESGSMSGSKIESVKNALQLFLRSLPYGDCRFNIISFGSTFVSLWPSSVQYSDENIATASDAVSKMKAALGGTEILAPLQYIYNSLEKSSNKSDNVQIFVLTDGEVTNTDAVLREVAKNHKVHMNWRLFTIGVGDSVSHALVEGMAREGRGTSQFIKTGEKMEAKIMSQLKNALQPALKNVSINWGVKSNNHNNDDDERKKKIDKTTATTFETSAPTIGCLIGHRMNEREDGCIRQAPYYVPSIFSGSRFIVYAMVEPNATIGNTVELKAESPDGPLSIALTVEHTKGSSFVHRLAARSMIRDLELGIPSHRQINPHNEIVKLGCQYQLVSKYTSFVAVEEAVAPLYHNDDHLDAIRAQIADTRAIMLQNIDKLLDRSERIALSVDDDLIASRQFSRMARTTEIKKSSFFPSFEFPSISNPFARRACYAAVESTAIPPTITLQNSSNSNNSSVIDSITSTVSGWFSSIFDSSPSTPSSPPPPLSSSSSSSNATATIASSALTTPSPTPVLNSEPTLPTDVGRSTQPSITPPPRQDNINILQQLVKHQSSNGSFQPSSAIADLINVDLTTLTQPPTDLLTATADISITSLVWTTAVVIAFIEKNLQSQKDEWELLVSKAKKWLMQHSSIDVTTLLSRSAAILH
eukprot:TRINITY_DN2315_c0_g2_i1.p1 TRINITY_DN2315_c0_g2~~TRINITY_DN2315_c0_g2_i1.p1  ORF type:complete len:1006 (-),score=311.18 TRINITY_DN2315_c0_g2_i1:20-2857(-)